MNQEKRTYIKIAHIITTLERGGAQKILTEIAQGDKEDNISHLIICLANQTNYSRKLNKEGFTIKHLSGNSIYKFPFVFLKLIKIISIYKPTLINTWLYHSDLMGCFCKIFYPNIPVVWSVHHASKDLVLESIHTKISFFFLKILSHFIPKKIIYCSEFAQNIHHEYGYKKKSSLIINNGVDTNYFKFDKNLRIVSRKKFGILKDDFLVGIVARFDPNKGIETFLRIVTEFENSNIGVRYLMCGDGLTLKNINFKRILKKYNLLDKIILLGEIDNVKEIYHAVDILVCPSKTESFGLVAMEAILCKTQVICSDIDALSLIVNPKNVCNKNNHLEFFLAIKKYISKKKNIYYFEERRKFISDNFSSRTMKSRYISLYKNIFKDTKLPS